LFNELKRRNVLRVGAAYVVVAWLVIQVVETIFPAFGFGDAAIRIATIVLAIGLIPTLVFSWAFELTPQGLIKDADVDRGRSSSPRSGKRLDRLIMVLLAMALGYFAFDKFVLSPERESEITEQAKQAGAEQALEKVRQDMWNEKSIAVLPFINRSELQEDEFFTDGMHDELLTRLARIAALKVISRTSVMRYRDTEKSLPEIARELSVATVLEGGVQRVGNQVRINVQLINAHTDEHLWAEIFDRELTTDNLFAIQSEISMAIADALQATLSPEEAQRVDTVPTDSLPAFEAYLRGRQLMVLRDPEQLIQAIEEFNAAVELDPNFALAWVGVADSNTLYASYGPLSSEDSYPIREDAIARALAIEDDLGEAYASLGLLQAEKGLNEQSEASYRKSIELSPNYATAWQWYGNLLSRFPERLNERIDLSSKAAELDPKSSIIGLNLAGNLRYRGLYTMAERQYHKVIELNPGFILGNRTLTGFYTDELGRNDLAMDLVLKLEASSPDDMRNLNTKLRIFLELGNQAAAEAVLEQLKDLDSDHLLTVYSDIEITLHKNNPAAARESLAWLSQISQDRLRANEYVGFVELVLGNKDRAREWYLVANPAWLDPDHQQDARNLHYNGCIVSWILLNTGDEDLGQKYLDETTLFMDETLPALIEHADYYQPEVCYLTAGDTEKALQSIELQLAHNHLTGWSVFHRLPMYDLIRHEPRYQAALQERERKLAVQSAIIEAWE
jgi:TolB-like protein/lipoprotein NlpI